MATLGLRSARDLIEALESGGVSSRELLEHYLERIERLGPAVNSVVTLDTERARKRADQADAARRAGQSWGPLHGLPMTVKDCFETAGLRTTAGAGELSDHVPTVNAVAVQRLLDAGAIVFGKTNTPTWAMDWQTHNKLFGTTNNPWDLERTCGGSSGGSAASVAAGFTALELGSDIGGSVRIPSHCCGVFGHKPSWGIVPVRGHIPGPPGSLIEDDINVIGPLARSADDLEIALRVLMGPLEDRAKGWRLELPEPRAERLQDFRVAAWLDDEACPVDSSVLDILKSTVEALRKTGVSVDDRARPPVSMSEAVTLYQRMLAPIVTSTMTDEQFSALTAVSDSNPLTPKRAGGLDRALHPVGGRPPPGLAEAPPGTGADAGGLGEPLRELRRDALPRQSAASDPPRPSRAPAPQNHRGQRSDAALHGQHVLDGGNRPGLATRNRGARGAHRPGPASGNPDRGPVPGGFHRNPLRPAAVERAGRLRGSPQLRGA
ncbi:MAG: amidase [Myxococcales bacterium]|nr:amidase [Myxococcales bacterium]